MYIFGKTLIRYQSEISQKRKRVFYSRIILFRYFFKLTWFKKKSVQGCQQSVTKRTKYIEKVREWGHCEN
jgi:hypothetical protein